MVFSPGELDILGDAGGIAGGGSAFLVTTNWDKLSFSIGWLSRFPFAIIREKRRNKMKKRVILLDKGKLKKDFAKGTYDKNEKH